MNDGRFADCFPCLKIRAMRFVFVSKAPYTTVKQNPAQNLWNGMHKIRNRINKTMMVMRIEFRTMLSFELNELNSFSKGKDAKHLTNIECKEKVSLEDITHYTICMYRYLYVPDTLCPHAHLRWGLITLAFSM